ncbi:hypothetical protein HOLleu_41300 [Holothuria leucospilota]|uniref:HTH psq-type domain-containing protein n=1 Tax=Holothuria leucospilota TaxID=206669 RepID=A0A9Q1BAL8_HOLLE|nr:hypothetical protein HOLleu_41300 [Holothuria leucospilota]
MLSNEDDKEMADAYRLAVETSRKALIEDVTSWISQHEEKSPSLNLGDSASQVSATSSARARAAKRGRHYRQRLHAIALDQYQKLQLEELKLKQKREELEPSTEKECCSYDKKSMSRAVKLVLDKRMSKRRAAKICGVSKSTLRALVKRGQDTPMTGKAPLIPEQHERQLKDHIIYLAKTGFPLSCSGVLKPKLANNTAVFLNLRKEFHRFMQRWPDLQLMHSQKLGMRRAAATSQRRVSSYYKELEEIFNKYDLKERPHIIQSIDETGFQIEHEPQLVVAKRGQKVKQRPSGRKTSRRPTLALPALSINPPVGERVLLPSLVSHRGHPPGDPLIPLRDRLDVPRGEPTTPREVQPSVRLLLQRPGVEGSRDPKGAHPAVQPPAVGGRLMLFQGYHSHYGRWQCHWTGHPTLFHFQRPAAVF